MGKHVFITVGTTRFDALIEAVDDPTVLKSLSSMGFSSLLAQIGHGEYVPSFKTEEGMSCDSYRYKPTLQDDMKRADLVISHAGAGSIMEALALGKALVVVVNSKLMDNHQEELANAMAERNYLLASTPECLPQALKKFIDFENTRTAYPTAKPEAFASLVDEEMHAAQQRTRRR